MQRDHAYTDYRSTSYQLHGGWFPRLPLKLRYDLNGDRSFAYQLGSSLRFFWLVFTGQKRLHARWGGLALDAGLILTSLYLLQAVFRI